MTSSEPVEAIYGIIPDDWILVSVGQLDDKGIADLQTGPFGTMLHASSYVPSGTPVIAVKNIGENRLLKNDFVYVNAGDAKRLEKYRIECGDILFGRKGAVDRRALITQSEEGWLQGSDCIRLRLDKSEIDSQFISYVLGSPQYQEWILRNAHGATMPSLNQRIIRRIPLPLPPLEEQKTISAVLSAFDDRIELNRQMNATLEEMARAIFKSWFVDFDPVHAKARGEQPYGMDAETAALFPDSFEVVDGREVPGGWEITTLADVAEVIKGRSYKSAELESSDTALVTLKSISRGGGYKSDGLKPYTGKYKPEQEVKPGEIVVAYTDVTQRAEVIGKPAIVLSSSEYGTLVASLDLGIVRSKDDAIGVPFLYQLFLTEDFQTHILGYTNGSTVLHLNKLGIPTYEFVLPPTDLLLAYRELTEPMYAKIQANEGESRSLAELRDTLLPRLISGQLRVLMDYPTEAVM